MLTNNPLCVDIYVSAHCFVSDYTWEVIEVIRAEFPTVELHVIDIAEAVEIPDAVFATPTYLLNGRVWSLGNPSIAQVREALEGYP
ncbi:hypothetical protein GC175_03590 [bacterium]|nr:hypothetical protein [bacterium]